MNRIDHRDFLNQYVLPFERPTWIYDEARGFIVWREGTGNNTELLHIRAFERGQGHGRHLLQQMVKRLVLRPPYYSVFGFTRIGNDEARAFYGALGFALQDINGIYSDGKATLFWQEFESLCRNLQVK